jgi:hypothetical protein
VQWIIVGLGQVCLPNAGWLVGEATTAYGTLTLTKQSWKKSRSVPGPTAKLCCRRCEMTERTVDSALGHDLP